MSKFLEIGEIIEVASQPVKVVPPPTPQIKTPQVSAPKSMGSDFSKQLLVIVGGIAIGIIIYHFFKTYQDENSNSRDKS